MSSRVQQLTERGLLTPPPFLPKNVHYEAITGSIAYGVATSMSDEDIYGFCIPPKDEIFPHLRGEIQGFGRQKKRFDQYIQHHIDDPDSGKEYDFTIFSIVKFFSLCMENNPNMVDVLFVPANCIVYSSQVGQMVREKRHIFLHRGSWHKFKGYAYSQLHKMKSKNPTGKRKATVEKYGFDVKFAYHVVRLMLEVEQIMLEGDLDLQRGREQLKSIRRGDWSVEEIEKWAASKEKDLEKVYAESKVIPHGPREDEIKQLLLDCLENHYGSLDACVVTEDKLAVALRQISEIAQKGLS